MSEANLDIDFSDGFIEGYLTGLMLGVSDSDSYGTCEREDCPRK